jgi:putative phage-type endonuclease
MLVRSQDRAARREQWLAARREGLGASDAPAVLGIPGWRKSPYALYAEKTGLADIPQDENDFIEWGHRLEPVIADAYADETGRVVLASGEYELQRHPEAPYLFATLDRMVGSSADGRHPLPMDSTGVLEIKTASEFKRKEWESGGIPQAYLVQVQHQLMVTGYLWGSLAVLIGGHMFLWRDIGRNEPFINWLREEEDKFWNRVKHRKPPQPDGARATTEIIRRLHPEVTADLIEMPGEAIDWDRERAHAMEVIDTYTTVKTECENRIRAAIGPHAIGILPNGGQYTWTTEKRAGYTVQPSSSRVLRGGSKPA